MHTTREHLAKDVLFTLQSYNKNITLNADVKGFQHSQNEHYPGQRENFRDTDDSEAVAAEGEILFQASLILLWEFPSDLEIQNQKALHGTSHGFVNSFLNHFNNNLQRRP